MEGLRYTRLGVDVEKKGVEHFKSAVDSLYPNAFAVVTLDPDSTDFGFVLHTDSAGSKPVQCYLHWREMRQIDAFRGLARDVVAMNLDDVVCVGARPFSFIDYVALNPFLLPKSELLRVLSEGFRESFDLLAESGLDVKFGGGETADLPDQILTLDVSGTTVGRVKLGELISGDRIAPGDLIVGLRSGGRSKLENTLNSGIMCNGITLARHCLMAREYSAKYPEVAGRSGRSFTGRFRLDDDVDGLGMTVGEAILSPTRVYAPMIFDVLRRLGGLVTGLIHNTGGGMTKCLRLGKRIRYRKHELPQPDPIFMLIKEESGQSWREMYRSFNMGIGFEVITRPEAADEVISICESHGVESSIVGECARSRSSSSGNSLLIETSDFKLRYA